MRASDRQAVAAVQQMAIPIADLASARHDAVIERAGDCQCVLLGEASHGSEEFYRARATITQRLIEERGFGAVAVEGDWPDAYRVNRYVRGDRADRDAEASLRGFQRFPSWMWRNTVVADFVGWLRDYNEGRGATVQAGFYGLDLYSLFTSIAAVIAHLDRVDPDAARRARARYACFDHFGEDSQAYGYSVATGTSEPCEEAVVSQLVELLRGAGKDVARDDDEFFFAEQNARLVRDAEAYYRAMFRGRAISWNLRDHHMADTLDALLAHLGRHGSRAKVVVWAHNSHLGDARATEMSQHGEVNVGQLVRERRGRDVLLVGFTTHEGTVTAATDWDGPAEVKRVRPSLDASVEHVCHETGRAAFCLDLARHRDALAAFGQPRLERAIGVIYRPDTERASHYFHVDVTGQFDMLIHVDHTRALEPLERVATWTTPEPAETYPSGM
jgi:erythromycin esterase-like protein